ncbi:hypothetical protein Pfo_031223, partial [Paulownia fortunei]
KNTLCTPTLHRSLCPPLGSKQATKYCLDFDDTYLDTRLPLRFSIKTIFKLESGSIKLISSRMRLSAVSAHAREMGSLKGGCPSQCVPTVHDFSTFSHNPQK